MQRALAASSSIVRDQYCQVPPSPCSRRMGGPAAGLRARDHAAFHFDAQRAAAPWSQATRRPERLRATVRKRLMKERAVATYSSS